MTSTNSGWYLPGKDKQPSGPFSEQQILQAWQSGQITENTLCWREGMPKWLPLTQVEPFAATIAAVRPQAKPKKSWLRRLVVRAVVLAVLAGAGVAGYCYLREWWALRKANQLFAAEDYEAAAKLLKPLAEESYLHAQEARYLLAVASIRQYATDKAEQDPADDGLRKPKRRLSEVVEKGEVWRQRARSDLGSVLQTVPRDAADLLPRSLALAQLLQSQGLADGKDLTRDLLSLAKKRKPAGNEKAAESQFAFLGELLARDPALADEAVALVLPEPDAPPQALAPVLGSLARWATAQPQVAKPLAAGLAQQADKAATAGKHDSAEQLLAAAVRIDPAIREQANAKQLEQANKRIAAGDVSGAVAALDRAVRDWPPAQQTQAAGAYLDAAKFTQKTDAGNAKRLLQQALALDPRLAEQETGALLWILLNPEPNEEKLRRCQAFLQSNPATTYRVDLLMTLVGDGTAAAGRFGDWHHQKAEPFLVAAASAAQELLSKHPKTANLDQQVYALAQRLAIAKQTDRAQELLVALGKACPDTPLKLEMGQRLAEWRQQQGRGTLDPNLDELADRVEKSLKISHLSTPAAVRALIANPKATHVLQVGDECTLDKFSSEEAAMLRQWVAQGGVLWVDNDTLKLFEISYDDGHILSQPTCAPAIVAEGCPVLTGCARVNVKLTRWGHAHNLSHRQVVPLLSNEGKTIWSLVRFGNGWISDVKKVDTATYDGARFWLNFRLFCMGEPIPGAKSQTIDFAKLALTPGLMLPGGAAAKPAEPVTPATLVSTGGELEKTLAELDQQQVLWLQVTKDSVSPEQVEKLAAWVEEGGVLWVDTDLARAFGFKLSKAPGSGLRGTGTVWSTKGPLAEGLDRKRLVPFILSPSGQLISGPPSELTRAGIEPVLGFPAGVNRVHLACALHTSGRGVVVYRPREFDVSSQEGKRLEENLRAWSFKVARPAKPKPAAEAKPAEPKPAAGTTAAPSAPSK